MILTRIYGYACLLLLCASLLFGALWQFEVARKHKVIASMAKAQVEQAFRHIEERDKLAKELAETKRRLPRAGRDTSDAIHQAPSDCSVSKPVGDSLRQGASAGNAARRGADPLP